MARILVTGITGQIGWYLGEALALAGHTTLGIGSPGSVRPVPPGTQRAVGAWTADGLETLLTGNGRLDAVVLLGARTDVAASWEHPAAYFDDNARLVAHATYTLLRHQPEVTLVHASSSNVFGVVDRVVDEGTPLRPVSPYGVSKAAAQLAVAQARAADLRASNLVYLQAVSPRCSRSLVVRKITAGLARVLTGQARTLRLGTMHVVRDVSHASDFASAAALLALGGAAGDYVCASGAGLSIRQMAEAACAAAGLVLDDVLEEEVGYHRPNDIPSLVGDPSRLRALGWAPRVDFRSLVSECLAHDLAVERELTGARPG